MEGFRSEGMFLHLKNTTYHFFPDYKRHMHTYACYRKTPISNVLLYSFPVPLCVVCVVSLGMYCRSITFKKL